MTKPDDFNIERLYVDSRSLRDLKQAVTKAEFDGVRSVYFNGHWMVLESGMDFITKEKKH